MATKKVKKLAFGGLSNAVRAAANKAATRIAPPQAPARGLQDLGAQAAAALQKAQAGAQKNAPSMVGGLRPYTSSMGDAVFKSLKPSGPSLGSGPMAKANPLQKIGSGPSRQAMMKKGGDVKESKAMVKKEIGFMKKAGAPKSMIKHEMAEAKGMKKGGMAECKTIAKKEVKGHEKRMHGMAKGGSIDGCAVRGKTKTSMVKMKKGGSC